MSIRILIADDHALLRQGIRNVLELEPDFMIVAEAGDGEEALNKVEEIDIDVALVDVNMPKYNGLEVTKRLHQIKPSIKVIVLTIHDDESYVVEVVKAGASGYLLKDIEPGMLIKAIRTVYNGESFIYPTLAKKLFGQITRGNDEVNAGTANMMQRRRGERLTMREIEVLQLIAKGLSNQEIAGKLFLSEKTVKNHLTNIFRKIEVVDRTQAVLYSIKNKIVVLD
ncbi:MAG: degU [Firmicutes bacterium]|nr:degU [Bacillota bacterium]